MSVIEKLIHRLLDMRGRNSGAKEKATSSADDSISLKAKGHITAELYDAEGNTVKRIDQDNLVVRDATNIILTCLSGVSGKRVWKAPYYPGFMAPRKHVRGYILNRKTYWPYDWYYSADKYPSPPALEYGGSSSLGVLYRITFHDPRESAWQSQLPSSFGSESQARSYEIQAKRYYTYGSWQEYRYDIPPETNLPAGYTTPESLGLDRTDNLYTYWSSRQVEVVASVDTTKVDSIFCDYSPSFIAIGDGTQYDVNDDDKSITYSSGWIRHVADDSEDVYWNALYHSTRWSSDTSAQAQFKFKGTKLIIYRTLVEDGAMMGITIDGVQYPNIDCWNPEPGVKCKVAVTVATGLQDVEHTAIITHTGQKNPGCASTTPRITFEGYATDGLHANLKRLYREIPTSAKKIELPEFYNTTNEPPYKFTLIRKPVPGTEKIVANGIQLTRAPIGPSGELLAPIPGQYQIDYSTGEVQLGEPAMKVAVTYEALEEFATGYLRALVEKPTSGPDSPIYNFAERKIVYQAEFPPGVPNYPVKITEMALMDGSLDDPTAKMFSIVRLSQPLEKYTNLGLRVVWEITIQAEQV